MKICRNFVMWGVWLTLAMFASALAVADDAATLSETLSAALRDYAKHGDIYLPALTAGEFDDLIDGDPVV
jgi:hypothetical protein